jgi:hypothetical protein
LESTHIDHFRKHGHLRLEGFHPKARMAPIKAKLLDELKRLGVWSGSKRLAHSLHDLPAFQQTTKLSSAVKLPGLHRQLVSQELLDIVAGLGGARSAPESATQLLLSLPHRENWTLRGLNWHIDVAPLAEDRPPGIQAFFLLDDVLPRGGATLAVAGSQRAAQRPREFQAIRDVLKNSPEPQADLGKLDLTIVEMSGRAGDVHLMDMRLLHTPSINASRQVRMMATTRFLPGT